MPGGSGGGATEPDARPVTRLNRVPSKPVRREADGRYAIDLWLQRDGRFDGDIALRLSAGEAELLHAQLCYALDDEAPVVAPFTSRTPNCRKPVVGTPEVRWP
ncbi:hypothetical protein [Streptomyces oceani]|uniref:Uncharacterized protein n=1 Tax=Streptomyces oceani TaxID=1075402 RepID=A0A1E7JXH5_9ACTN|nr:hypothetical protein [Streptomyces oceani]OEU96345.1 hypothetical protein AN216_21025 [Streptomyces oceani]